jgi:hypothetical protein
VTAPRPDILRALDDLRRQVECGEVECVAIVAITADSFLPAILVGEPQSATTVLSAGLVLVAHCNQLVADLVDDDEADTLPDLPALDTPGDERAN